MTIRFEKMCVEFNLDELNVSKNWEQEREDETKREREREALSWHSRASLEKETKEFSIYFVDAVYEIQNDYRNKNITNKTQRTKVEGETMTKWVWYIQ